MWTRGTQKAGAGGSGGAATPEVMLELERLRESDRRWAAELRREREVLVS